MSDGTAAPGVLELDGSLDGPGDLPVLVLGNSLGTTRAMWDPQVSALSRHFRLLRFDWPGHGSPAPPVAYTMEMLGRGVLSLLDRYQVVTAAYTGLSLGGMAGMWLAANAPGRITRIALCCTSACLDLAWAQRAATVRSQGMDPIADGTADRWFTAAFQAREPETVAALVATVRQVTPAGYAGLCDAIRVMDQRASLPAITAPTLVIAGSEDPATPPWHGAVIASAVPGARLTVIRGASHLANVSQPAEMTALLLGHLTG